MVKTAISSQRKSSFIFISSFFSYTFPTRSTHTLYYVRGTSYFFLQTASKPVSVTIPGPQLDTRRHCQKKSSMVSLGLRGDPNHQFQFLCLPFLPVISLALHSTGKAASGSQPPPLHSSVSCRQLWLQLLQNVMTLQVSPSCPQSLSTSPSRGATQVSAAAVATSQP